MIVRKGNPEDVRNVIPLYKDFLKETKINMSEDEILSSMMKCCSNIGLFIIAEENNEMIAFTGGVFQGDIFIGDVAYVKPEYRNLSYKFVSKAIRTIKKKAKEWIIICSEERFDMWHKLGFKLDKVVLRRQLC